MRARGPATATSAFGSGRRENHDAGAFYARFPMPVVSKDSTVATVPDGALGDGVFHGDARSMTVLPASCVALVVTSPPYFAGKEYEEALGTGVVPASYVEYLALLRDVFAECVRVLEPGGRIAVNVANLGRRPYRSLAADVVRILQDDLGLLLRGEVVWRKGAGASGSCAWGSFRRPANPVLRDLTERVVIASKGRFDRSPARTTGGVATLSTDEFLAATLDVWDLPPESARRVGHPAPFPVALPERLIRLYTYEHDLVLDPFCGSGSTLVAARRLGRRWVGFDTDESYVALARARLESAEVEPVPDDASYRAAAEAGEGLPALAARAVAEAGFSAVATGRRLPDLGIAVDIAGDDATGRSWSFDVTGGYTTAAVGLRRVDVAAAAVGRAAVLSAAGRGPVVLLTSHVPAPRSEAGRLLRGAGPAVVFDVVDVLDPASLARLREYATGTATSPLPGFW